VSGSSHFITRGVPVGLLPVERLRHGRCDAAGTVLLATDAGDPILAVRAMGRGRVVAFAYDGDCLAPREFEDKDDAGSVPGIGGRPLNRESETIYSLLCRAIVWAARREPSVTLAGLAVEQPIAAPGATGGLSARAVAVRIADTGRPGGPGTPVHVHLTLRNETGRETLRRNALVALAAGRSRTVRIPLPAQLDAGLNVADVILTDGTRTCDWGSVPLLVERPATVDTVDVQQRRRIEGRAIVRVVRPAEVQLTVTLTDRWDRLLARHVLAQHIDGAGAFRFVFRPQVALSATAVLRCAASVNGRHSHALERTVRFEPPRVSRDLVVVVREGPADAPPRRWWPALDAQYVRLGITAIATSDPERGRLSRLRTVTEAEGVRGTDGVSPPARPASPGRLWQQVLQQQRGRVDVGWRFSLINPDLTLSGIGKRQAEAMDALNGRGLARLILGVRTISPTSVLKDRTNAPNTKRVREGHLTPLSLSCYRDGPARYLAAAARPTPPAPIEFERDWDVYDSIAGRYLGRTRRVTLQEGSEPVLLALLPYRVTGMRLEAPAAMAAGKTLRFIVRLRTDRGLVGRHVVAVDVIDPTGARRPAYHINLDGSGGVLSGTVPLALNDPPGRWTLRARDAATGTEAEARVEVKTEEPIE